MKADGKTPKQHIHALETLNRQLQEEIRNRKQAEERITHLNAVLKAIRNVNQLIVREKRKERLIKKICQALTGTRGYYNCWMVLFDEKGDFDVAAQSGVGEKFAKLLEIFQRGDLVANIRKAIKTPGVCFTENPSKTCGDCPLSDQYAGKAALYVRLEHAGRIYGVLAVSLLPWAGANEQEQILLDEIADDIAFALYAMEMEEKERASTETLRQSEERYRALFDRSLDCVYVHDFEGNFLDANEAALSLLGYDREEIPSLAFASLLTDDQVPLAFQTLTELKETGWQKELKEFSLKRKDGQIVYVESKSSVIYRDQKPVAVLGIARDITRRKQAEKEKEKLQAQLNQAQKMEAIGVLAGGVAHDFNNLLTTIIGNADLALMDLQEETPVYHCIEEMRKAGKRAAALTRQLLAFSRKQTIQPEIVNLNEIIMESEKMLRRLIGEDIDFVTVYEEEPWHVCMDPGQVDQILMNLAVNARDAMPKGGKLTIETANVDLDERYFREHGVKSEPGQYIMVAVTDTGVGMDRETQARIFEPFFTTKGLGRGTGLGLSTTFGIVKQNNGLIWVYSEEGKGTTFKIYLPRSEKQSETSGQEKRPLPQIRGTETILLVEDEEALRDLAKRMLGEYGYTVVFAGDGEEALKRADDHKDAIHLLLTDVVMPAMDGKELAEKLQSKRPEMKVLFMSGYTDNAVAHHGILDAGLNFIQKPFTAASLAQKVREVLDG